VTRLKVPYYNYYVIVNRCHRRAHTQPQLSCSTRAFIYKNQIKFLIHYSLHYKNIHTAHARNVRK